MVGLGHSFYFSIQPRFCVFEIPGFIRGVKDFQGTMVHGIFRLKNADNFFPDLVQDFWFFLPRESHSPKPTNGIC